MADETQNEERVPASELAVGDEVWIPNSRKAQAIEQITAEGDNVALIVGDATWNLKPEHEVRRLVKVAGEEE